MLSQSSCPKPFSFISGRKEEFVLYSELSKIKIIKSATAICSSNCGYINILLWSKLNLNVIL